MAAKVKKTAKKTAKKTGSATSKSAAKVAKKPKSTTKTAAKSKVEPKKSAVAKKAPAKSAKKAPATKKVAKKVVTKEPKPKKANNNKIVGKQTAKKKVGAKSAKVAVEKTPAPKKSAKPVKEKAPAKVATPAEAVKSSQKNVAELTQEFTEKKAAVEVLLTDAEGRVLCKFNGCDEVANVEGYCRYHYLLNWKRIQLKKKILSEGKLEKYINELTAKYPDKYIEMLKGDLKSEKDFLSVVNELEIDDSDNGMSDDEEDNYIEQEVQGVSGNKRSSDDDY